MTLKLEAYYDKNLGLVVGLIEGEIMLGNIFHSVRESMLLAKKNNCRYILFDITKCDINRSLVDAFTDMASFSEKAGMPIDQVCAVLYDPEKYSEERAQFIESIVNLSSPFYKMFMEKDAALSWIRGLQKKGQKIVLN